MELRPSPVNPEGSDYPGRILSIVSAPRCALPAYRRTGFRCRARKIRNFSLFFQVFFFLSSHAFPQRPLLFFPRPLFPQQPLLFFLRPLFPQRPLLFFPRPFFPQQPLLFFPRTFLLSLQIFRLKKAQKNRLKMALRIPFLIPFSIQRQNGLLLLACGATDGPFLQGCQKRPRLLLLPKEQIFPASSQPRIAAHFLYRIFLKDFLPGHGQSIHPCLIQIPIFPYPHRADLK